MGRVSTASLARRILLRLDQAEAREPNLHLQSDYRIAWLTVLYAWRGDAVECSPHVLATQKVLGLHPDHVWPAIEARRRALLGPEYEKVFGDASSPKKPVQSVKLTDLDRPNRREG